MPVLVRRVRLGTLSFSSRIKNYAKADYSRTSLADDGTPRAIAAL